jgi:hypothetical protein
MDKSAVIALLEAHKNERGIANWNKLDPEKRKLKTFGLGLTQLRKLAKKVGRDHQLAKELWQSDYYDAKIISLLIDDPKKLTPEQAKGFQFAFFGMQFVPVGVAAFVFMCFL